MTRPFRFALLIGAAALFASACSSADIAATVNDVEIHDDQVLALAERDDDATSVRSSNPCQGQENPQPDQPCIGFRDDLTVLVFLEGMVAAAEEDYGITGIGTVASRAAFFAAASPQEQQVLETLIALPGRRTQGFLDIVVDQLDVRSRVQSALIHDEENLTTLWSQRPEPDIDYCLRHVLVATEQEANDVLTSLEAGENFSVVASEVSLAASSQGGALTCPTNPASLPQAFADAIAQTPIGTVSSPVETEFGWHVISVDPRLPTSYEELASDPDRWVPPEARDFWWSEWVDDALSRADVTIRSQIGTWISQIDGIAPPPDSP